MLNHLRNKERVKTSLTQQRKKHYEYLKEKIRIQSRATTSKIIKNPDYEKKNSPVKHKQKLSPNAKERNSTKRNIHPKTKICQKRIKSNLAFPKGKIHSKLFSFIF